MFYKIYFLLHKKGMTYPDAYQTTLDILSLMGENGNGVSDSPAVNGALPRVGKSECLQSDSSEVASESEHGTLENRIDSGMNFKCPPWERCKNICNECAYVNGVSPKY